MQPALSLDGWTNEVDQVLLSKFSEVCLRRRRTNTQPGAGPHPEEIRSFFMTTTAQRFACLQDAWGIDPWQYLSFIGYLNGRLEDAATVHAGRFIMFVYGPRTHWGMAGLSGWQPFNLALALGAWGPDDRAAFEAWLESPVWP
jgi:hypothetical protein